MLQANYIKYPLRFLHPAGTSRGVLTEKDSWFVILRDPDTPGRTGIGECSLIPGLSRDRTDNFEDMLKAGCDRVGQGLQPGEFPDHPAIMFGFEMAMRDLDLGGQRMLFPSAFSAGKQGIPINGLIWMGSRQQMQAQVEDKMKQGFRVLKLKVGAIRFSDELSILETIRSVSGADELELRLDANGAWSAGEAPEKLEQLSKFNIHSIEQPIAAGQTEQMAGICATSPIPVALDEELIGNYDPSSMQELLSRIRPAYIILKPSLLGGFAVSGTWIRTAEKTGTGWWVTSALESNIGLNAIAQWTATLDNPMPQGLGTGGLYENNIPSPLVIRGDHLWHRANESWNLSSLKFT